MTGEGEDDAIAHPHGAPRCQTGRHAGRMGRQQRNDGDGRRFGQSDGPLLADEEWHSGGQLLWLDAHVIDGVAGHGTRWKGCLRPHARCPSHGPSQ